LVGLLVSLLSWYLHSREPHQTVVVVVVFEEGEPVDELVSGEWVVVEEEAVGIVPQEDFPLR